MTHFTLADLNPAMRRQAEAKLRAAGTVRRHRLADEKELAKQAAESPLEAAFALQLRVAGIEMVRQHKPIPDRQFKMDFADPVAKVGVECDGAVHRIKSRFLADVARHNILTLAGWRWIRAGRAEINSGQALEALQALLGLGG